jgi:hypothetical protein
MFELTVAVKAGPRCFCCELKPIKRYPRRGTALGYSRAGLFVVDDWR